MKIKRKVQKTLPQLIEWGFKNDITNKEYVCNEHKAKSVIFNLSGWAKFSDEFSYNPHHTFTVEIEEEINECSDIKRLAHYTVHGFTSTNFNKSIGELRKSNSLAFYIMNDDRTLTLIWTKEKGLVE